MYAILYNYTEVYKSTGLECQTVSRYKIDKEIIITCK